MLLILVLFVVRYYWGGVWDGGFLLIPLSSSLPVRLLIMLFGYQLIEPNFDGYWLELGVKTIKFYPRKRIALNFSWWNVAVHFLHVLFPGFFSVMAMTITISMELNYRKGTSVIYLPSLYFGNHQMNLWFERNGVFVLFHSNLLIPTNGGHTSMKESSCFTSLSMKF